MSRRVWVRLDNASNMFLAARSDTDTKVFRISAEADHEVDPVLLQEALDATYDRYRLYHAVLRSGVFWYYLQDSDQRPRVSPDDRPTCAPIYRPGRRDLLFRVMHHRRRIILEVFHALSDGTGALWFLSDLVHAYLRLREPDGEAGREIPPEIDIAADDDDAPEPAPDAAAVEAAALEAVSRRDRKATGGDAPPSSPSGLRPRLEEDPAAPAHELVADSFAHWFRRRRGQGDRALDLEFSEEAAPAALTVPDIEPGPAREGWGWSSLQRRTGRHVHEVRGTRSPDNRTRLVELTMPASPVLDLARREEVTLTMLLLAMFFESIRQTSPPLGRARTFTASVPVNLRQFFPSTSPRNFFTTVTIQHTYGEGDDDLGSISRGLERQFRPQVSREALARRVRLFSRFERMPGLRIVPRPLKDLLLGLINSFNNRSLTVAISNLGRVQLPPGSERHIGRMLFHVSAARPQFCAISHAGQLTISFTSPFVETDHVRAFARMLTDAGVEVSVAASRVTEAELAWAETT